MGSRSVGYTRYAYPLRYFRCPNKPQVSRCHAGCHAVVTQSFSLKNPIKQAISVGFSQKCHAVTQVGASEKKPTKGPLVLVFMGRMVFLVNTTKVGII